MQSYDGHDTVPTFQYDEKGNYECCYDSIRDAAKVLNIPSANISDAIKLGTICYNKYFSNVFAPTFSISRDDKLKTTPIYQYDLDGNFIAEYSGMPEAKKKLGIKSDIYKAIKLGRTVGGYQWSFEKLPKIAKVPSKSGRARRIGKYDKDWNLLVEYKSLAECKRENGSGMVHVLTGRDEFAKGFRYKYLD
ncbi:MAG: hypothetical protein HUJ56_03260 [Erysipelotrichaceae bacterium]|nr:hypothetical protein [Erysipelotrichaceae bacterium]